MARPPEPPLLPRPWPDKNSAIVDQELVSLDMIGDLAEGQPGWAGLQRVLITPFAMLQKVGGAADAEGAAVDHMGVDHRCVQVPMAHQLLDGADVLPALQQMGGLTWP